LNIRRRRSWRKEHKVGPDTYSDEAGVALSGKHLEKCGRIIQTGALGDMVQEKVGWTEKAGGKRKMEEELGVGDEKEKRSIGKGL